MDFGKKQGKISREKESISKTRNFFLKGKMIILASFLALVCLSTMAFGVGTISGHVDNTNGNPITFVYMNLYQGSDPQVADENAWDYVSYAYTDGSGNYQFTNLAPRYYRIQIPSDTGYAEANVYNVPVVDNQDTVRNITLQVAGSISGNVLRHSDNSPLQGVQVIAYQGKDENLADDQAWDWAGDAYTDNNGFYKITGLGTRRYRIRIDHQEVGGTHYVETDLFNVQAFAGADTSGMDIMMRQGARIWGHVTSTNGTPIRNANVVSDVSWTDNGWDWHNTWTDDNGYYELWVLPSPGKFYPVSVRQAWLPGTTYQVWGGTQPLSGSQGYDPKNYGFTQLGTGTTTKTFSSTYTYYVILTEGGYVAHVDTVEGSNSDYYGIYTSQYTYDEGYVGGAPDGQYAQVGYAGWNWSQEGYMIVQVPSGNTSITVHIVNDGRSADPLPFGSKWEQGYLFKATIGQPTQVDYILEPGGTATGRVVNESNVGIENVRIPLEWNKYGSFGDDTYTDSQGNFRLGGLTVGNENYITLDNWWQVMQGGVKYMAGEACKGPINIAQAGDVVDVGNFTIYEAGMVTGLVTDENGDPVVDVEVDLNGRDIDGNWAERDNGLTDAFGQYTLDFVAPGTYSLECQKPGFLYTIIRDIQVGKGQHVDQDVVINSQAKGATISGSITNYSQIAAKDPVNSVYYPYYEENDYEEYGFHDFGLIAMDLNKTYTDEDYLDIDQFFVGDIENQDIEDGYGDYFQPDSSETPGNYTMPLPPGDIGIGMYIGNPEKLPGGGGSAILHDWKRFTLAQGDSRSNIDFTANIGSTGTLKGSLIVPSGYNYLPGDWCMVYAFALDSNGNRINPAFLCDAVAFSGYTTQYEFIEMPAGNYQLKAYARNLPSVIITSVTVSSGSTTTQDINFTGVPSGTLSGTITNTNGGAAVSGATVKILENGKLAVSDNNGNYTMSPMNTGTYTVKVTAQGFADAQTTVTIVAGSNTLDYTLDSNVGSISGTVKDAVGGNVNAATVVAYNETDYSRKTAQTVGGAFTITGLTPGQYVLAVDAGIYGVVTHPATITLSAGGNEVVNIIVGTPQAPAFAVISSASNTTPVVLSMEFYSDQDLLAAPQVSIVQGNGALGSLTSNSALNRFNIDYTADAGDTLVQFKIEETTPIVTGNPGSNIFSFEVTQNLVATSSTNVTNAIGGTASIMGTQDNTEVYVPPFAIAGAGSDTQALTLTIERYGDPGQTLSGTTGTTASAVYDFEFDQQGVSIDTNHTFTVTMSFQLPANMTEAEFESSLELRYFDAGDQQWKTDGISNVRINWLNYTIIFEVSHLTKFAAFVPVTGVDPDQSTVEATTPVTADGTSTSIITITAKDTNGNPMQSIAAVDIIVSSTGTDNTITQPATATDASGQTTATISSTVAETKTISVVINGTAINDTASVDFTTVILPTVGFGSGSSSGSELVSQATLDVTLSTSSSQTVIVDYAVSGGTATLNQDYLPSSGQLTFVPGDQTEQVPINVIDDSLYEGNETVIVTLSNASGASLGANTHTYTIIDNETVPSVGFAISASNGFEDNSPAELTIDISGASAQDVIVNYSVTAGTATASNDYTATGNTVTFPAGETESKTIDVTIIDDSLDESDEMFSVTLTNATNANIGAASHTYTILDNDNEPDVSFTSASHLSGKEGVVSQVTMVVNLSVISGKTVTVDYSTSGDATEGVDYNIAAGPLTFSPGETTQDISLTIVNDSSGEANETIIVTLSNPTNATIGTNSSQTYTIENDDSTSVEFSEASSSGPESESPASIAVGLLPALPDQTVMVDYAVTGGTATGDGVDYTLAAGTLTFSPGDTQENIEVLVVDDSINEQNETIIVTLSNPTNAIIGTNASHTYTIMDDDDETAPYTYGYIPEPNSVQLAQDTMIQLHVADEISGVDVSTVQIRLEGEVIYDGTAAEPNGTYNSSMGKCRCIGTEADYTFVFLPSTPFNYEQKVDVAVNASDEAGNEAEETYHFYTVMRSFSKNYKVNSDTGTLVQDHPASVTDSTGNKWVVWDQTTESGGTDIYIGKLATGDSSFGASTAVYSDPGIQSYPVIAIGSDDTLYVAWQRQSAGSPWDIYVSKSTNGTTWSIPVVVNVGDPNNESSQTKPSIGIDILALHTIYIAYQDDRAGNSDIWVATSTDGISWTETQVTSNTSEQTEPVVVSHESYGRILWTDARNVTIGKARDIYEATSEDNWVQLYHIFGSAADEYKATAAYLGLIHALCVSEESGFSDIIYANDSMEIPVVDGIRVMDESNIIADDPTIALTNTGSSTKVFAAWKDGRNVFGNSDTDIYFAESGSPFGTNILVNDDIGTSSQSSPVINVDFRGNPYVVWVDERDGNKDIYYAGTTYIGHPLPTTIVIEDGTITVQTADNVQVTIPAGALPDGFDANDITISKVNDPPDLPVGIFGICYNLGPSGLQFNVPVTITIPHDVSECPALPIYRVYWYDTETGTWSQEGISNVQHQVIDSTTHKVSFQTTHFTVFGTGNYESNPASLVTNLIQDVVALNLQRGIANSLEAKLNTTRKVLEDTNEKNNKAAINTLGAFINAVEDLRGDKISDEDADSLIKMAKQIIYLLTNV